MKNSCIVGYGAIGPIHAAALNKCKDASLIAVCDINNQRAMACADKYNVKIYEDFDTMLLDKNIDVVHICTPHYLHKDMAVKALKADKDVVLEKPVAMNLSELSELYSVKTDRKICVMLQNRTNTCIVKLRDIIKNDTSIGKMLGSAAFLTWNRTKEYYESDEWRGKWETEGGGLLINQAIHTLDLIDYLSGGIKSVKASISTKRLNSVIEVEDTADAVFEMNNGSTGLFYASNAYSTNAPVRLELYFENATFRYADEKLYKIVENEVSIIEDDINNAIGKNYWGSGHSNVINAFYSTLAGDYREYTTLKAAKHTMELLFAVYKSAKENSKEIII